MSGKDTASINWFNFGAFNCTAILFHACKVLAGLSGNLRTLGYPVLNSFQRGKSSRDRSSSYIEKQSEIVYRLNKNGNQHGVYGDSFYHRVDAIMKCSTFHCLKLSKEEEKKQNCVHLNDK